MSFTESSFIIKNNDTLWGCGWNSGTLGLGESASHQTTFTQITTNTDNVKSIYGGYDYAIMLKNDGTLWGCGTNSGQLGLGDKAKRYTFTQITDDIKSVYCGFDHMIILKNDNTLWGCGTNSSGQLGLEDINNRATFTIINSNPGNIKSICCGSDYTIILQNNGTLWGCGNNGSGQLGLGDTNNRSVFTKITDNVKSTNCGYNHTIVLKNDGTLWSCGDNTYNQLGLGDTSSKTSFSQITTNTDNIKSIYCEYYCTFILKKDNTLWGCGWNVYGQLGLGDGNNKITFTQITANADNIKSFMNDHSALPSIIKIYDTQVGYVETLDTNDFRNIPVNSIEVLKVLYAKPINTILNCAISFDKKQTWKTFNGTDWITISNISPENMILNCMEIEMINSLDKKKLISGGFTGDLDFKIAMKTNNANKTPSVTKIYIEYK